MKTIVLTGGGTAGHVMPAIALLPFLKGHKIIYIGSNGIEKKILEKHPEIPFHEIECAKLRRSLSIKNLTIPFKVCKGTRQAKRILREIKADIVFSKGGFVSYPVTRAAKQLGIPVILHESDLTMGLANRLGARHARLILTAFSKTAEEVEKKYPKKVVKRVGAPLRREIYKGNRNNVGISNKKRNLLVMGGSQGAKKINDALRASLPDLLEYNVIHITGVGKMAELTLANYTQIEYTEQIADYIDWADMVVSRAGANSVCELLALKKAMLLIPLSTGRGDQMQNAKYISEYNCANVLWEESMTRETLTQGIEQTFEMREMLSRNCSAIFADIDGAERTAEEVLKSNS